jgi:hypothetical protein
MITIFYTLDSFESFDNCKKLNGNGLSQKVEWLNNDNLINADKLYIKCIMKNCDLYTISGCF